ncbi:sensor histidine kinase [Pseudalkalibacillus salsuginis]|uniref:sensor histidine kinase n=1 Tax=Pseudalkalibacillus salsuginis TaxID=2910972 RepID=UPI001F39AF70|nr:sensor histidine kinase [Pseudalkalibacillus salsuginis]MCF6411290.1 sensor histidine kinase [Pseudalkalibacillus salsuginis]
MNIIQRQVLLGLAVSLTLLLFMVGVFFFTFPLNDWSLLWSRKILDLPFILFAFFVSTLIGIVFGFSSGIYWRRQLEHVVNALAQIGQGRPMEAVNVKTKTQEFDDIWSSLERVQQHISEQTKLSQKLANEKAEDQEKRIQKVVSEERNRLARELHDSVSQQLFAASMLMSAVNESNEGAEDGKRKQLKLVEGMIHQSQLEMRALLLHLRPVALKGKTLEEGIKELLLELSQKVPLEIEWKLESIPLKKGVEDHLFRILQESVSNTLRHAKANSLEVLCIEREGTVLMRVVDDGVGFDVETSKAGSYGLQNMHERAVELGGTLKIISVPDKGTRLEVRIPVIREGDGIR